MRAVLWIGVVVLILGVASFFVTMPQKQREGIRIGDASVGIETTTSQKVPVYVSVILLVGGISMVLAGARTRA